MYLPEFYLILFSALALGQIALAVYLFWSEKEFIKELSAALGLTSTKQKSWSLWHKTFKKTQNILGQAELEGVKVVADTKYYTRQLEGVYEGQLREATERMEKEFGTVVASAQQEFGQFLASLEKSTSDLVDDAVVSFTKRLEERLTEETARVEAEVKTHQQVMVEKVDRDMIEIIDQVAKTVLGKKLPATEQTELVLEALEQAKKEKFVAS